MDQSPFILPPFEAVELATPLSEIVDWSLKFLGIPDAWARSKGKGVKVCVLDTGIDTDHPDIDGAIVEAKDFSNSTWGPKDRAGHGTWCCGQIVAKTGNDTGVCGIAPDASMYVGKVLGDGGTGAEQGITAGIRWAHDMGVDVLSLSLGGRGLSAALRQACLDFVSRPGKFIFAAAGNSGKPNDVTPPAVWPECISVGAVGKDGKRASFSSMGKVDIAAPGVDMLGCWPGGRYMSLSGTSMACPTVAAVAVLAIAVDRADGVTRINSVADMLAALKASAKDVGEPGQDAEYGFGLIDPAKLLDGQAPQPPATSPVFSFPVGFGTVHVPAQVGDDFSVKIGS